MLKGASSLQAPIQPSEDEECTSASAQPESVSVACMLGAAVATQRLRLLSTILIQQHGEAAITQPADCFSAGSTHRDWQREQKAHSGVTQEEAAGLREQASLEAQRLAPDLQPEAALPAAAEPQSANAQQAVGSSPVDQAAEAPSRSSRIAPFGTCPQKG